MSLPKSLRLLALSLLLAACSAQPRTDPAAGTGPADPSPGAAPPAAAGVVRFPVGSPQLRQLKIEPVASAEVPASSVTAPGKIDLNPNRVAHVVAPMAGRIVNVLVKLGDSVRQGAPVLKIESPDADAAVAACAEAQAAVLQAKSALLRAEADLSRNRDLYEHKAIAEKEVINAESIAAQSRAALDQANAAERQALRRLEILQLKPGEYGQQLVVTAPVAGKVLEVNAVPGEFRNDLSGSLLTIADLSTVWAVSQVPETEIRFIHVGEPITVTLAAYPGEEFHGWVAQIADTVDPQSRTIRVSAELNNPGGRLRPEMFGEIRHEAGLAPTPVVPAGAVVQSEKGAIVYREISSGAFEPTGVTVGETLGKMVAVRSGLVPGQRIVTEGALLLKGF